jgi:hypothetical protein
MTTGLKQASRFRWRTFGQAFCGSINIRQTDKSDIKLVGFIAYLWRAQNVIVLTSNLGAEDVEVDWLLMRLSIGGGAFLCASRYLYSVLALISVHLM